MPRFFSFLIPRWRDQRARLIFTTLVAGSETGDQFMQSGKPFLATEWQEWWIDGIAPQRDKRGVVEGVKPSGTQKCPAYEKGLAVHLPFTLAVGIAMALCVSRARAADYEPVFVHYLHCLESLAGVQQLELGPIILRTCQ